MQASPTSNWRPSLDEWETSIRRASTACSEFIAAIETNAPPRWLTLAGVPGCGKTFLAMQTFVEACKHVARATANHPGQHGLYDERKRRPNVRWLDETNFARLLLDDRQYDLPEHVAIEWLVVYDDLGSKRDSKEAIGDALYRLANQRLGKWTIWTTNFTLEEIGLRIDARLSSRLVRDDNRIVTITAGDYATRKARK